MPHFRKIEKGAVTTVVADEAYDDTWELVHDGDPDDVVTPVAEVKVEVKDENPDEPHDSVGQPGFPPVTDSKENGQ